MSILFLFCFHHLDVVLQSGHHCFWWEVSYYFFFTMSCFLFFPRAAFKIIFLIFSSLTLIPSVVLFILLVIHWASWICKSLFFIRFGKCSGIISFLGLYYIYINLILSHWYLRLFIFLPPFFPFFFKWNEFYWFIHWLSCHLLSDVNFSREYLILVVLFSSRISFFIVYIFQLISLSIH